VGYHPAQKKIAIVELDGSDAGDDVLSVKRVSEDGTFEDALSGKPTPWGKFLRYKYVQFDFSAVTKPGMYVAEYRNFRTQIFQIAPDVYQKLLDYSWPGNVRELQNAIEYAVVLAREGSITVKELPAEIQLPPALQVNPSSTNRRNGVASLEDVERETILQALAQTHGNKKKAAQLLGIQRPTLYNKMKRYAIEI